MNNYFAFYFFSFLSFFSEEGRIYFTGSKLRTPESFPKPASEPRFLKCNSVACFFAVWKQNHTTQMPLHCFPLSTCSRPACRCLYAHTMLGAPHMEPMLLPALQAGVVGGPGMGRGEQRCTLGHGWSPGSREQARLRGGWTAGHLHLLPYV